MTTTDTGHRDDALAEAIAESGHSMSDLLMIAAHIAVRYPGDDRRSVDDLHSWSKAQKQSAVLCGLEAVEEGWDVDRIAEWKNAGFANVPIDGVAIDPHAIAPFLTAGVRVRTVDDLFMLGELAGINPDAVAALSNIDGVSLRDAVWLAEHDVTESDVAEYQRVSGVKKAPDVVSRMRDGVSAQQVLDYGSRFSGSDIRACVALAVPGPDAKSIRNAMRSWSVGHIAEAHHAGANAEFIRAVSDALGTKEPVRVLDALGSGVSDASLVASYAAFGVSTDRWGALAERGIRPQDYASAYCPLVEGMVSDHPNVVVDHLVAAHDAGADVAEVRRLQRCGVPMFSIAATLDRERDPWVVGEPYRSAYEEFFDRPWPWDEHGEEINEGEEAW